MRTTLVIDDELLKQAKKRAVDQGETLSALVETALREKLAAPDVPGKPFKLRWKTMKGKPLPGVNLDDRDSLYDLMEGGK